MELVVYVRLEAENVLKRWEGNKRLTLQSHLALTQESKQKDLAYGNGVYLARFYVLVAIGLLLTTSCLAKRREL